jgi:hypothetical protein
MTQKPETDAEPPAEAEPGPELPESVSDVTRGPTPKIQPMLMGFVIAAIIGMISLAAFWNH